MKFSFHAAVAVTMLGFVSANSLAQDAETSAPPPGANVPPAQEPVPETVPVATLPPPSDAASDDTTEVPEVIVTANRRRQNLREIAGSNAAVSGEDLEKIKAQSLSDYIKLVPGVVLSDHGGADDVSPIIRGIATETTQLGVGQFSQQPTGIYVDDMPFTDLYAPLTQPDLNPFDLERVEILKGPQGTLLGSGAFAGAIRYITQKPKLDIWETKLSATVTSNNEGEGLSPVYGGAQNIPLFGDKAAIRVVGLMRESNGKIDETNRGARDVDGIKQATGRVLGRWAPNEQLQLDGLFFAQQSEQMNQPFADNPREFSRDNRALVFRESKLTGANITANYNFEWASLLSSTNYLTKALDNNAVAGAGTRNQPPIDTSASPISAAGTITGIGPAFGGDPDGDGGDNGVGTEDAGIDGLTALLNATTRGLFQEFRLSSPDGDDWKPFSWLDVQWLVGGAYQRTAQGFDQLTHATTVIDNSGMIDNSGVFPVQTPIGPLRGVAQDTSVIAVSLDSVAKETAVFGETTLRLFKRLELTAGGRAFKTQLNAHGFVSGLQVAALNPGNTQSQVDAETKAGGFNPRVALRYVFHPQFSVFALASKGFQFGGIQLNPPLGAVSLTPAASGYQPYKSSRLWNYEAGVRMDFFDKRLKWDTTWFYLDWKDLQITVPVPLAPGGGDFGLTIGFTENIGKARSTGIETVLSVSPVRGLSMASSAAFIRANVTEDFPSAAGFVRAGTRLPGAPRFQIANVVSYGRDLPFGGLQTALGLTHTHISSSFNNLQLTRMQGGYDTFDASFNLVKSNWAFAPDVTVSMLNLFDTRGVAAVSATPAGRDVAYFFIQPRTLLLSLSGRF